MITKFVKVRDGRSPHYGKMAEVIGYATHADITVLWVRVGNVEFALLAEKASHPLGLVTTSLPLTLGDSLTNQNGQSPGAHTFLRSKPT